MNPEIGDIIDCRNAPGLEHFIVVLGTRTKSGREEVMYYLVTSRVYAVFLDILDFFNDCITRRYARFFYKFPKEKGKSSITPHGRLCDAFFFDKRTDYDSCLDADSMIVLNKEPDLMDIGTLKQLYESRMAIYRNRLTKADTVRLVEMVKLSENIGPENKNRISASYNTYKRTHHP